MKKSERRAYLFHTLPAFLHGIAVGAVIGAFIFFFRYVAEGLVALSHTVYHAAQAHPAAALLLFAGLFLAALLMALIHRLAPSSKGGGIPRSEGILRGALSLRALPALIGTVVGSFISFFCGLPLGSEGPSVLAGTAGAHLLTLPTKDRAARDRYIMTGGACAGFAVATGSPLSAILFALEEVHKRFTPMLILVTSASVLSATAVNRVLCAAFGMPHTLFSIPDLPNLSMQDMGFVLLAALFVAVAVYLFDLAVSAFNHCMRHRLGFIPHLWRLVTVFMLTGVIGLFAVDALYGGGEIILSLLGGEIATERVLLLFLLRFGLIILISNSGATGGIFVPTLTVGALIGALSSQLFIAMGMDPSHAGLIILLSMSAFMGGTMRAPLTAAVFFVEVTAQYENLFFVTLAVFLVYLVTELVDRTSFYDIILEEMEKDKNAGKTAEIGRFEVRVSPDSFVIGKAVRDILWPHSAIVTAITREGADAPSMDNGGEKKILEGDTLIIKVTYYDEEELRARLIGLVGDAHKITRLPN